MKRPLVLAFLFLLGCQALLALHAYGATIYVVPNGTYPNYPTIQQGIDAAANSDTVIVRDGTYPGGINFNGKLITVKSENGPNNCIIDGGGSTQGVSFVSGENTQARLDGFTIKNCASLGSYAYGGGIYCSSSSPTITNCIIYGNSADYGGGGIYCGSSSPTITNCTISGNSAEFGGGILCNGGSPKICNCTISGSSAYMGAGILCNYSSLSLTNCTISGNSSSYYGGGISFSDCYTISSTPTITNCTISGNSATDGGGIWMQYSSTPKITNCTIYGNSATEGAGIDCLQSTPTVVNSILWNNIPQEIYLQDSKSTMNLSYSDIQGGFSGTGNINSDPLFVNAASGDFHLLVGSPCIDRASNAQAPATDKDGVSRPLDGDHDGVAVSDMGAYEYQLLSALVTAVRNPSTTGYLPDDALRNPKNRAALRNKVEVVIGMINRGLYEQALGKLEQDILPKTDGCALRGAPDRNDWIVGCKYQAAVYDYVRRAMEALEAVIAQK